MKLANGLAKRLKPLHDKTKYELVKSHVAKDQEEREKGVALKFFSLLAPEK